MNAQLQGHLSKASAAAALKISEEQITAIYCCGEEYWDAFTSVDYVEPTIGDIVKLPKSHCDACAHYGGYCGNCDGSHWH